MLECLRALVTLLALVLRQSTTGWLSFRLYGPMLDALRRGVSSVSEARHLLGACVLPRDFHTCELSFL